MRFCSKKTEYLHDTLSLRPEQTKKSNWNPESKNLIESRVQYFELNGQRIPVSPDGIPMLNMAKPITPAPETLALKMEEMVKSGRTPQSSMKRLI